MARAPTSRAAAACGAHDRVARRVVDGDAQAEPRAAGGRLLGRLDGAAQLGGEPVASADDLEPHAVGHAPRRLRGEVAAEEAHERPDLGRRAAPVVGREGVEGERADAERRCGLDEPSGGARAGDVARGARASAPRRPASVAVHDARHVTRRALGREGGERRHRGRALHSVGKNASHGKVRAAIDGTGGGRSEAADGTTDAWRVQRAR
jgi:hypothetical protein